MLDRPDWRDPDAYRFTQDLNGAQWAWEFMRRNPEYQKDWGWFITTWQALENDYGAPPDRDFSRWKRDPRAWRDDKELLDIEPGAPHLDSTPLMIECWMGAKWGFARFPLDPELDSASLSSPPLWRQSEPEVIEQHTEVVNDHLLALAFDLSLPLKAQLETARVHLASEQHRRLTNGQIQMQSIASCCVWWTLLLRLLDGSSQDAGQDDIRATLFRGTADALTEFSRALREANNFLHSGYLRILDLPEKCGSRG